MTIPPLEAGPELDAVVARWYGDEEGHFGYPAQPTERKPFMWRHHGELSRDPHLFSSGWDNAQPVLEKLRTIFDVVVLSVDSSGWELDALKYDGSRRSLHSVRAPTFELALCAAVLEMLKPEPPSSLKEGKHG